MKPIRIIGLGNTFRGDDGVGICVARRLREIVGAQAEVLEAELAGIELLDLMKGCQAVVLVDAAHSGQRAGTIHRLDASTGPIGENPFPHSTHAINAVDALEVGRALGVLPPSVIVYGIEAEQTSPGRPMSPAVAQAMDAVASSIARDIEDHPYA